MATTGALVKPELLVIGLDGATFDVIDPMVRQGRLPHLARLMREGTRATLRSTLPPYSAPAWTSFLTGLQPGRHGVHGWAILDREQQRVRPRGRFPDVRRTLLGMLNAADKRVCCVGVPMTHPPFPVDGFLVPGADCPFSGPQAFHPAAAYEQVADIAERLSLRFNPHSAAILKESVAGIELETQLVLRLQQLQPCEAVIVVFPQSDQVGHLARSLSDADDFARPLPRVYAALDEAVGRLLAELTTEDTTVLVLSDHGMSPQDLSVDLDVLLRQMGLMAFRRTAGGWARELVRRALRGLRDGLRHIGLDVIVARARRSDSLVAAVSRLNPAHPDNVDWRRTRVVPVGNDGFLWMNVAGREREGVIPGAHYEAARAEIIARLRAVTTPEGRAVFDQVLTLEEAIGANPADPECADILLLPRPHAGMKAALRRDARAGMLAENALRVPGPQDQSGWHDPHGIFIYRSPHTPAGAALPEVSLPDMTPTLLHALGLPVPAGLDGRVIAPLFEDLTTHPVRYGLALTADDVAPATPAAYTAEEEAAIQTRLQDLGYL